MKKISNYPKEGEIKEKILFIVKTIAEGYKIEVEKILNKNRETKVNEARWCSIYAVFEILGRNLDNGIVKETLNISDSSIAQNKDGMTTRFSRNKYGIDQIIQQLKKQEDA